MPLPGAKPKPEGQKRHRVKPQHDWKVVPNVPFSGGPKLPAKQPSGLPWPKTTRDWWRVVSSMPHCILWNDGDWRFAIDTAAIVATFHAGDVRVANELRQRETILGMTLDSRMKLRIRYLDDEESEQPLEPGEVTSLADYRASI